MKYRLLYLPQASPGPFRPLFSEVEHFFTVLRTKPDSIGPNDVILYGGGTDVDPSIYGEERSHHTQIPDIYRDEIEGEIFNVFKERIAGFIGVCRGSQYLTVLNGGKLVQHVGGVHCRDHKIVDLQTGESLIVTSTHHQMMYPYGLDSKDYEIIAAPPRRLCTYYDGAVANQYSDKDIPYEPEVVWYPKTKSLCIQGHPEYVERTHPFPEYCRRLVKERILA